MLKYCLLIPACLSFNALADGIVSVYGVVTLSCGGFSQTMTGDLRKANVYEWWVAGFVTGTNVEKDRILPTDNAAHLAWLKQYCDKNPLDTFMKAALELNKELDKRRTQ